MVRNVEEWEKMTLKEAIAAGNTSVSLEFHRSIKFQVMWDSRPDSTDEYGHYEFQIESFFTFAVLDMDEDDTVQQLIDAAWDFIVKNEIKAEEE